uniref:Uncharacterized protein n=1 Tax=Bactrocera latifrons TaxID=174628 RepID=A0A0K8V049_BACLA
MRFQHAYMCVCAYNKHVCICFANILRALPATNLSPLVGAAKATCGCIACISAIFAHLHILHPTTMQTQLKMYFCADKQHIDVVCVWLLCLFYTTIAGKLKVATSMAQCLTFESAFNVA